MVVKGVWRLARPLFLLGGVSLFGLGVVMALAQGAEPVWPLVALGQATVLAGQLLTHFSNDYFDREADSMNATPTPWSGGSRVLVDGEVSPRAARNAMRLAGAIAAILFVVLTVRSGGASDLTALVAVALVLSWAYSSPPARLHARGLGEGIGALLLALVTPMVGLLAAGGRITPAAVLALAPLALFQFAMLVAVSLPDRRGDAAAGKRTLAVRWGGEAAARVAASSIGLGFLVAIVVLDPGAAGPGDPAPIALGYLVWLPLGIFVALRLVRGWDDEAGWSSLGFWSIGLVMGSAWTTAAAWAMWGGL